MFLISVSLIVGFSLSAKRFSIPVAIKTCWNIPFVYPPSLGVHLKIPVT
jgi:hypothetical protein